MKKKIKMKKAFTIDSGCTEFSCFVVVRLRCVYEYDGTVCTFKQTGVCVCTVLYVFRIVLSAVCKCFFLSFYLYIFAVLLFFSRIWIAHVWKFIKNIGVRFLQPLNRLRAHYICKSMKWCYCFLHYYIQIVHTHSFLLFKNSSTSYPFSLQFLISILLILFYSFLFYLIQCVWFVLFILLISFNSCECFVLFLFI